MASDFVGLLQADGGQLLRLLDQRHDDIALPSFHKLLADELPPPLAPLVAGQIGIDLLPARRAVAQDRNVQIAEERHGDRPRDGRGGHHQVMRIGARMFQRGPLPHAELVLLVDHHQAELGEADVFLQDGLRADDQVDPSGGDFFQHGGPLLGRHAAGQFRAADLAAGRGTAGS